MFCVPNQNSDSAVVIRITVQVQPPSQNFDFTVKIILVAKSSMFRRKIELASSNLQIPLKYQILSSGLYEYGTRTVDLQPSGTYIDINTDRNAIENYKISFVTKVQ